MPLDLHSPVSILIHPSQFPGAIEASLRESLRTREMNHKFHYDTPKQTQSWLRLHEAFSPARTDPACLQIYKQAFADAAARLQGARAIEIVSLGCGGGQKDVQFLRQLAASFPEARLRYVPVDVSSGLALTARAAAIEAGLAAEDTTPVVIDLAEAGDWMSSLGSALDPGSRRAVCFFGMLPNFVPESVLPSLASLLRPDDLLLMSANLAPGSDYATGVQQIMPLYDNLPTRDWLWSVLQDLGIERADGRMDFSIVQPTETSTLLRVESRVTFLRDCHIAFAGSQYDYATGDAFRLFFSYRHTPERLRALLAGYRIQVAAHWTNPSGEEGVFACQT
jgi:L-histidine N-alpha-methyltransferase